jgi:hypothetical protein
MNTISARESTEITSMANEHLKTFNSQMQTTIDALGTFGKYLSKDMMEELEKSSDVLAGLNKDLAMNKADDEYLQNLSKADNLNSTKVVDGGGKTNYRVMGRNFTSEEDARAFINEQIQEKSSDIQLLEQRRKAAQDKLNLDMARGRIQAGFAQSTEEVQKDALQTMQQNTGTWRSNLASGNYGQMLQASNVDRMRSLHESEKGADRVKFARQLEEEANAERTQLEDSLEYHKASNKEKIRLLEEFENETRKKHAQRQDANTRGEMWKDFDFTKYEKSQQLDNTFEQQKLDLAATNKEHEMRDAVALHQKRADLESQFHQDRLKNVEDYANKSRQAVEQYAKTALETYASGRGANPLEENKKMALAAMEADNEEKKARRKMEQEERMNRVKMEMEMKMEEVKQNIAKETRQIDMEYQHELAKWKLDKEMENAEKIFKKQMEYAEIKAEHDLAVAEQIEAIKSGDKGKMSAADARVNESQGKIDAFMNQPGTHADDSKLGDFSQRAADAHGQGIDRIKNLQMQSANATHAQAMKNAETEHKHSLAYMVERAKKERELNKEIYLDKFRARQIELQTSAESTQRSTDTEFAKSIFSAKSGTERMQASAQHQFDSEFNSRKSQMEQKHATQTEEQEKQGATEEQRAQLKQQQEREKGELEQQKSFRDAIVGALGGTGSLRDVAKEQGVGQKSGLMEAHERIKASAFGHIKDPVADAVNKMEREQTMQHQQLVEFLVTTAPNMISAMQKEGNAMTVQTWNNYQNGLLT